MTTPNTGTGLTPTARGAIVYALLDVGFPREQAEAWAHGWACRPDTALVVNQAIEFDDHGVPVDQAIAWHQHGFYALEACGLYDMRWAPDEAATARDFAYDNDDDLDDWVAVGLAPQLVIACLRAGYGLDEIGVLDLDLSAAVAQPRSQTRSLSQAEVRALSVLTMMAALRY